MTGHPDKQLASLGLDGAMLEAVRGIAAKVDEEQARRRLDTGKLLDAVRSLRESTPARPQRQPEARWLCERGCRLLEAWRLTPDCVLCWQAPFVASSAWLADKPFHLIARAMLDPDVALSSKRLSVPEGARVVRLDEFEARGFAPLNSAADGSIEVGEAVVSTTSDLIDLACRHRLWGSVSALLLRSDLERPPVATRRFLLDGTTQDPC